jgi:proteasome activator subunit 4
MSKIVRLIITYCYNRHKKRLGPEDITLEWRPLYNIIDKTLFPKARQRALISES